jgi:hypothetical protein
MSSTKNIKGNRQIVVASYTTEAVFKIPDGVDLEDKTVVSSWGTKYARLYIYYVNSDEELEIEPEWETEIDYKYSSDEIIEDADENGIEYEEDNEQKCRDCDYTWTTDDFDAGKGRVAFSYPSEGIKEGDVVCTLCHVKEFNCHNCETLIVRDSDEHDNCFIKHDDDDTLPDKIFCKDCYKPKYEVRGFRGDVVILSQKFNHLEEARLCYNGLKESDRYASIELDNITYEDEPEMIEHEVFSGSDEEEDEIECPFCEGQKCGQTNPPYFCDNGCGIIVGCGVNHDCVRICKNCKCESDDGEDKEYRITDIDFDTKCESDSESDDEKVNDRDEFIKSLIKETCSKTWFACDEEQLCDQISDETGWLINSYSCELVCEGEIC